MNNNTNSPVKLIVTLIATFVLLIVAFFSISVVTIKGNELGIKETWKDGVVTNIMQPGTYFLFPGWSQKVVHYDASSQVFVMNDIPAAIEKNAVGREHDSYLVQSSEGQDMHISMNLRYRLDPEKLVSIHKTVRMHIDEKLIRPVLMRVVKDQATTMKAIDAYSGEGLVRLQSSIQRSLSGNDLVETKELKERGILIENFVIEHIALDTNYIAEIKGKQIATQKQLRSIEEQKAAEAQALVAKALAQADFNKQVVEAERDAKVRVTAATAANESAVIAAKAEQQKLILEAEGQKEAMIAKAEGTLAMGKAEAQAKELLLKAWAVPGAESFVKVEVSKNIGVAFSGIKGYLPEKMTINTFTDNFLKGLDSSTGNPIVGPTK